jgi:hypothetical protein
MMRCRRYNIMNYWRNDDGIALVMVMVLALVSLTVVTGLIFMATQRTKLSGSQKFFRTAEEASYGGAELATDFILNRGEINAGVVTFGNGCDCNDPEDFEDNVEVGGGRTCFCDKLCNPFDNYDNNNGNGGGLCDEDGVAANGVQVALDPTVSGDFNFTLGIAPSDFDVFVKIVDTVQGNSDVGGIVTSGGQLGGAGVVASNSGLINPPHTPYLYRVEVQAQASANVRERSRVSLLYAF